MMNPLGLAEIDAQHPFLTIFVKGKKLSDYSQINSTTNISVTRVGETTPAAVYTPLEVNVGISKIVFVVDSLVFNKLGGRYKASLMYLGNPIGDVYFIYNKPIIEVLGSNV